MYVRLLQPPARGRITAEVESGEALFASLQCVACHVPTLRTGDHELSALANQEAALYSDLLIHDMGEGLADHRPDGDADGYEWRTAPLWGTRLVGRNSTCTTDGRHRLMKPCSSMVVRHRPLAMGLLHCHQQSVTPSSPS
jgi:CxxC motif-containing protein (DUF1111 family)